MQYMYMKSGPSKLQKPFTNMVILPSLKNNVSAYWTSVDKKGVWCLSLSLISLMSTSDISHLVSYIVSSSRNNT